jgi:two-component system, OmpR family, phosphate regulon response regulator PhoB
MSGTVLIIEDDEETRNLLSRALRKAGHTVFTAADCAAGLDVLLRVRPAVVLLDLILPDMPGDWICASIRANPEVAKTHVIMVTGLDTAEQRIAGFELGADDYITKPFDLRELLLRVEAALRHSRTPNGDVSEGAIVHGGLRIDVRARRAWIYDNELELTEREYLLLSALTQRPGKLLSREELTRAIGLKSQRVDGRSIDTHVKRLRQKLGTAARAIETVRGAGYRLATWF